MTLTVSHLTFAYPKAPPVLEDVSFTVPAGDFLSVLGANGAGKSTLFRCLLGGLEGYTGTISLDGRDVRTFSRRELAARIAYIPQIHRPTFGYSVLDTALMGLTRHLSPFQSPSKALEQQALTALEQLGVAHLAQRNFAALSGGEQQLVLIARALCQQSELLIMDEPTAVLTPQESEHLMQFIKDFTSKGNSVVFITHKMKEVMEVADRIVVMRNGVVVDEVRRADTDEQQLARLMIGQEIVPPARDQKDCTGDPVLTLRDVSLQEKHAAPLLSGISFTIRQGEIFGIAGVSGNGQDDLCDVICGLKKPTAGQILLSGQDITGASIRRRNACGIGYVPVDRYRDGMVMDMTLSENILLKRCFDKGWFNHGFIRREKLDSYTNRLIENHRVKANDCHDTAGSLSGGNQQKVVLGREVDLASRLLILNQPTRGLDMGAVDRIHHVILEEKANQKAVLLISTELSEIFELCDRIAVMHGGRFMGIYRNGQLTTQQIGLLMAGVPLEEEVQTA